MSSTTLRWLHRIGYAASLIIVVELALGSPAKLQCWQRDRRFAAMAIESSRIHDTPIAQWTAKAGIENAELLALLAKLPRLADLGPDGLRFAALPGSGKRYFAVAFAPRGGSVDATMVSVDLDDQWKMGTKVVTRHFTMPAAAYLAMSTRAERLFDGWQGYPGRVYDGNTMALERVRGSRVISGAGVMAPYEKLGMLMRRALAPYAPEVGRLEHDWSVPMPASAQIQASQASEPTPQSDNGWESQHPTGD